jgi:lipopolysaccharide transport system ATP-binding protein
MAAIVELASVSKRYSRRPGFRAVLAELVGRPAPGSFLALHDVNLCLERGEQVGVLGVNGAGKSTLLRILGGVTAPTAGRRTVAGRVAALSEMQASLHRELTGRENLLLLANLAGRSSHDVMRGLDAILDFAGLPEELLDVPVKDYSAGMGTRLAVSVAATADAGLVVVDEGIAGADAAFRRKCFERLDAMAAAGSTIVLASHDLVEIRQHCRRGVLLDGGRVVLDGSPDDALDAYLRTQPAVPPPAGPHPAPTPTSGVELRLAFPDSAVHAFRPREELRIDVHYTVRAPGCGLVLGVEISTMDGARVCLLRTPDGERAWTLGGSGKVVLKVRRPNLAPGLYCVSALAWDPSLGRCLHRSLGPSLRIDGRPDPWSGPVEPPEHEWSLA